MGEIPKVCRMTCPLKHLLSSVALLLFLASLKALNEATMSEVVPHDTPVIGTHTQRMHRLDKMKQD